MSPVPYSDARRCKPSALRVFGGAALLVLAGCSSRSANVTRAPDTASRLHVAQVAEASGQQDIALSMYGAAAEAEPGDMAAQSRYAGALARSGQIVLAEQAISRARQRRPNDPTLAVASGRLKLQAGQAAEAMTIFDQVLAREPNNAGALIGRGVAFDLLGQYAEAQRSYRAAQSADPGGIAASNDLAMSLMLNGQPVEAVKILSSLSQSPNAPARVRYNLGVAQAVAGDSAAASTTLADKVTQQDLEIIKRALGAPSLQSDASTRERSGAGE
jgi:Flp pilus assembly protein TadD